MRGLVSPEIFLVPEGRDAEDAAERHVRVKLKRGQSIFEQKSWVNIRFLIFMLRRGRISIVNYDNLNYLY